TEINREGDKSVLRGIELSHRLVDLRSVGFDSESDGSRDSLTVCVRREEARLDFPYRGASADFPLIGPGGRYRRLSRNPSLRDQKIDWQRRDEEGRRHFFHAVDVFHKHVSARQRYGQR